VFEVLTMKKIYLLISLTLIIISSIVYADKTITLTPTTETTCENNQCTQTLYSSTRYVFEDGVYKKVEEARSLKGKMPMSVAQDNNFLVQIGDWNATYMYINLSVLNTYRNQFIPIRIYDYDENGTEFLWMQMDYKLPKTGFYEYNINLEKLGINLLGKKIKWGLNSTTIIINVSNNGIIGDTYVNEASKGTNYDTATTFLVKQNTFPTGTTDRAFIKFNYSSIPNDAILTSANLTLYSTAYGGTVPGLKVRTSYVDWFSGMNWTTNPCGQLYAQQWNSSCLYTPVIGSSTTINCPSSAGFVTLPLNTTLSSVNNASIPMFVLTTGAENATTGNSCTFGSSESTNTSRAPYLTITYNLVVSGGELSNCTFSGNTLMLNNSLACKIDNSFQIFG
jgi:hypothetical protein